jgi:ribonucleoside-diphosphate reductase alpha chain
MLPPYGACLLGSVDLTKFIINPFTDDVKFDYTKYINVVKVFARMLDNVVEINNLPLENQRKEILNKRRHGMGFTGLGSSLVMMKIPYNSPEAIEFTEKVSKIMAVESFRIGAMLSTEKGEAPILTQDFIITQDMIDKNDNLRNLVTEGVHKLGDVISGRKLWILSHYFDNWRYDPYASQVLDLLIDNGSRFTHATSIAPTGTISLSVCNNVSNGIEPSFSHFYKRNVLIEGKKSKSQSEVYSYEFLLYKELVDNNLDLSNLPDYFIDTNSLSPEDHINIQAAAQKWIDSSISKTINVPTDISFNDFKHIYMYAYKKGLKGCAVYRYNPENFSGVLVKDDDLNNTTYIFTLEDGSILELNGNDIVNYDGEEHVAANLADAITEGYYGKI